MADNEVTISDKILNATFLKLIPTRVTPNQITMFRFFTIPFVIFLLMNQNYILAIILFVISVFSDALDGARARVNNQVTDWGKLYDPVADKLLIGTTAAIVVTQFVSPAVAFVIIGLEVIIVASAMYQKHEAGTEIEAKWAGKIKMIAQSLGVGLLLLYIIVPFAPLYILSLAFLYAAIFFALLSIFVYKTI